MGVWGWIVLYVLLFALLQLLIYRYLRSDEDAPLFRSTPPNRETTPIEETPIEEVREFEERRQRDDSSVVVCPRCGAENDAGYTYCRNCVSPMSAR